MKKPDLIDPRLLTGAAHFTRVRILELLQREPSTATQLRREIKDGTLTLGAILYHLEVLEGLQLIELIAEQKHGNFKAKVFGMTSGPILTGDDWREADLPKEIKSFFGDLADDLGLALLSDAFAGSPSLLQRVNVLLDETGHEEVHGALAEVEATIERVRKRSEERAAAGACLQKEGEVVVLSYPMLL
jgi:DNA-binding transcriptional ArsR family regulator